MLTHLCWPFKKESLRFCDISAKDGRRESDGAASCTALNENIPEFHEESKHRNFTHIARIGQTSDSRKLSNSLDKSYMRVLSKGTDQIFGSVDTITSVHHTIIGRRRSHRRRCQRPDADKCALFRPWIRRSGQQCTLDFSITGFCSRWWFRTDWNDDFIRTQQDHANAKCRFKENFSHSIASYVKARRIRSSRCTFLSRWLEIREPSTRCTSVTEARWA